MQVFMAGDPAKGGKMDFAGMMEGLYPVYIRHPGPAQPAVAFGHAGGSPGQSRVPGRDRGGRAGSSLSRSRHPEALHERCCVPSPPGRVLAAACTLLANIVTKAGYGLFDGPYASALKRIVRNARAWLPGASVLRVLTPRALAQWMLLGLMALIWCCRGPEEAQARLISISSPPVLDTALTQFSAQSGIPGGGGGSTTGCPLRVLPALAGRMKPLAGLAAAAARHRL